MPRVKPKSDTDFNWYEQFKYNFILVLMILDLMKKETNAIFNIFFPTFVSTAGDIPLVQELFSSKMKHRSDEPAQTIDLRDDLLLNIKWNKIPMKDKVCIITGSGSGIGFETALGLAEKWFLSVYLQVGVRYFL